MVFFMIMLPSKFVCWWLSVGQHAGQLIVLVGGQPVVCEIDVQLRLEAVGLAKVDQLLAQVVDSDHNSPSSLQ